jgi:hypothetical protein
MKNRRRPFDVLLLSSIALVVVRHVLGGQPAFRGEFVIEDSILLLALACVLAPHRFKPIIRPLIACSMSITMALIAWTTGGLKFPLIVFALIAIYSAFLGLTEVSKLRRSGARGTGENGSA